MSSPRASDGGPNPSGASGVSSPTGRRNVWPTARHHARSGETDPFVSNDAKVSRNLLVAGTSSDAESKQARSAQVNCSGRVTLPRRSTPSAAYTNDVTAHALPDTQDRYPTWSSSPSMASPRNCPRVATIERVPPPEKQTALRGNGRRRIPAPCSGDRRAPSSTHIRTRRNGGDDMRRSTAAYGVQV